MNSKRVKKIITMFLAAALIIITAVPSFAASSSSAINSSEGYSVPATMVIEVGQKKTFKVTEAAGRYANVAFSYSTGYVTTSGYSAGSYWGKPAEITFTGQTPGTFTATAIINSYSQKGVASSAYKSYRLQCKVTVVKKSTTPTKVALQKIAMNKSTLSLTAGGTANLSVSFTPANTTDSKKLTWTSSNSAVASVSGGKVTAKKAGTATISAKTSNGKIAKCKVTVKAKTVAATGVTLSKTSASVTAGKSFTLTATVKPANATNKKVTWSSSNTAVASVSGGKVTAKKAGTATISAKTSNGKIAKCKVTVKAAQTSQPTSTNDTYKIVTEAYTLLNTFRTTKANQWYWNADNRTKTTTSGLGALKRDITLENIAKVRAKEAWIMYWQRRQQNVHDRPNGQNCWTAYTGANPVGENLAFGQTTCKMVITDPDLGWAETNKNFSGQGHRRNMLSNQATKVGIACYVKDGVTCWAMCLGR